MIKIIKRIQLLTKQWKQFKFAKRERLPIAKVDIPRFCKAGIISEKHTGFKEDDDLNISEDGLIQYRIERPKFQQLIHSLIRGEYKGVIFLCWDRASRNRNDDNVLRKLMKKMGVDIRFVQANYDNTSAGALHMDVDGMLLNIILEILVKKLQIQLGNFVLREYVHTKLLLVT